MAIIDMTGADKGPYTPEEQEIDPSVPLITDISEYAISIYNALNNNTDQISVGLTLALLHIYF